METFLLNLLNTVGNINFTLVGKIFALVFIVFWIVVLDWVWTDAGERTSNRTSRIAYLLLPVFLNIFGWIIYLIIRPSQTIEQIYWSDLERRYLKYETAELGDCPKCGAQLYPGYTYCPKCGSEIKTKCTACEMYIDKNSKFCPYCGERTERERTVEEQVISKEIMEQQINESKEEAAKVVANEQTRYSVKKRSLTVKLGSAIIGGYQLMGEKIKQYLDKKPKKEEVVQSIKPKKRKEKKKKKKH